MGSLQVYDFTKKVPLVRLPNEAEMDTILGGKQLVGVVCAFINEDDELSYYSDGLEGRQMMGVLEELKIGLISGSFEEAEVNDQ